MRNGCRCTFATRASTRRRVTFGDVLFWGRAHRRWRPLRNSAENRENTRRKRAQHRGNRKKPRWKGTATSVSGSRPCRVWCTFHWSSRERSHAASPVHHLCSRFRDRRPPARCCRLQRAGGQPMHQLREEQVLEARQVPQHHLPRLQWRWGVLIQLP